MYTMNQANKEVSQIHTVNQRVKLLKLDKILNSSLTLSVSQSYTCLFQCLQSQYMTLIISSTLCEYQPTPLISQG